MYTHDTHTHILSYYTHTIPWINHYIYTHMHAYQVMKDREYDGMTIPNLIHAHVIQTHMYVHAYVCTRIFPMDKSINIQTHLYIPGDAGQRVRHHVQSQE